jgi:Zn-dependent peptidase ImmA (M78 family)
VATEFAKLRWPNGLPGTRFRLALMPTTLRDPTKDAEALLADAWSGDLPIDPVRIARSLGMKVVDAYLEPDVSGAIVKQPEQDPIILLNANDSPNRKRFTCAHEIGHYVKRSGESESFEYIDRRDTMSTTGRDPEEVYANQFAAALLMPADEVRKLADEGLTDVQMALRFDVSLEAMRFRLQNLGLS